MTENGILALINRNIDSLKQERKKLLASNRSNQYLQYSLGEMIEATNIIKIKIDTLELLVAQIVVGGTT